MGNLENIKYFDYQATTPIDPRVLDSMLPYMGRKFGNPHSRTHQYGYEATLPIEKARQQIAQLINCDLNSIYFTSGATESNNLALKGISEFELKHKRPVHIITSQIDHKCVLDTCRQLELKGVEVTYLPVNKDGLVNIDELKKAIKPHTKVVSIIALNNEIGTVQNLESIGNLCRKNNIYFHTDGAQAFGKIPLDMEKMNIDLMSISGHKIYGPKGVGALYIRRRPRVRLLPQMSGGGQERGIRSGTLSPFLIVGLGRAAEIAREEMIYNYAKIKSLSEKFYAKIKNGIKSVIFNRADNLKNYFPGCVNLSFPYVEGEGLLMKLKKFALSSGSACTSESLEPSYVLRAIGTNDENAHSSIRFGFGKFTLESEVDKLADKVISAFKKLRRMSPLYEMVKDGVDLSTIEWTN